MTDENCGTWKFLKKINSMRLAVYSSVTVVVALGAILHAYSVHKQFYPTCIHLTLNSGSFMALMNMMALTILYLGKLLQRIFIGPLRVIEGI